MRILFSHILPNVAPLALLFMVFSVTGAIASESVLSFLGLLNIDSGKIFFEDKSFHSLSFSNLSLLRKEIGMVFQGSALFDSMSVLENIIFPLRMFSGKSEDEIIHRGNEVIKRVDLKDANNKLPSEISGGMKKRVAIARAIVLNPKYLFCDEPNSGLDPKTAIIIDNLIKEITEEYNITTVINTHDMNSVMEIGQKIIFLVNGRKIWEGTKEEIFDIADQMVDMPTLKFD